MPTRDDVTTFDLIIIGAGSGNLIPGPEMDGWSLAIVEPNQFGGTCLNRGCIPSKMLLYPAGIVEDARHGAELGVYHTLDRVDWKRIVGRVWEKIDPIAEAGAAYRKSQPHVTVYDQPARFVAPRILQTGDQRITAERMVLGAGSRPVVPDLPGLHRVTYHTSDTIMRLERQPQSILIIGGGYVGAEMASFFGSLGTHVTLVDRGGALIKNEDDEIARAFTENYQRRFDILLHAQAQRVQPADGGSTVDFLVDGSPHSVTAEVLLLATGRRPNSDRLDVDVAGIETDDRGRVLTDDAMETSVPGIYAFGDLASRYQLKHTANAEARHIARQLLGGEKGPVAYDGGPHAIFGNPQVASVGLTERQAVQQGVRHITSRRQYAETAYGWASNDHDSFVKLVADPETRLLLGAHIIGPQASLLIQPLVQGMKYGQTVDQMAQVIYIHPALTEVVEQALLEL
ncbi:MAG TPA: mycothione reductase [Candidatus Entotheonella sp.]|jgi:mycothione reductase